MIGATETKKERFNNIKYKITSKNKCRQLVIESITEGFICQTIDARKRR